MNDIFGGLLEFGETNELDNYLDKIEKHDAIKLIELSIIYCQKNGIYNLSESHLLYKCLNKLKEKDDK